MGKQATIDEQANTPVPGAEGIAENQQEQAGTLLKAQTPEWVGELLESNLAVIASNDQILASNLSLETLLTEIIESGPELLESNKSVVDTLIELKDQASRSVGNYEASQPAPSVYDHDADYEVAEGKSFRDPKDFTKEYTEGDNVSHLGETVLVKLLEQGLVIEEA